MTTWPWTRDHHPGPAPRRTSPPAAAAAAAEAAEAAHLRYVAYRLDGAEPAWHVFAGRGELVAMPLWDPGRALVLTATTPAGLLTQMRETEQAHPEQRGPQHRGGPVPSPSPSPRRRGPTPPSTRSSAGQERPS
ncbi:hypothetical protein [Actinomadura sp. 6N118]|uniref:hypothetical protein n=1 Tax=Actinomadura sp. 6N118 TaxID=3375151 RepID=UPI0037A139B6